MRRGGGDERVCVVDERGVDERGGGIRRCVGGN